MNGYQPTPADIEALEQAAAMLDTQALTVRLGATVPPEYERWPDAEEKVYYDDLKASANAMYALAERLQVALEAAQLKLPLAILV